jgi:selenocysteine-specific elongation factor
MAMKRLILGTAGHIDHGKTTLVKALLELRLTGSRKRSSGVSPLNWVLLLLFLPDGQKAAIVDVPGHERFIKHMLAGAFGMRPW